MSHFRRARLVAAGPQIASADSLSLANGIQYEEAMKDHVKAIATAFACALGASSAAAADDALLQAVSFFITGSDASAVTAIDRAQCIFRVRDTTYFFNNIDTGRLSWSRWENGFGAQWTYFELHGKGKVVEDAQGAATDRTLRVASGEKDKLLRAWQYIYSHGCKEAKSLS